MDNKVIEDLRKRIASEPSVLFLGQKYLNSKSGTDMFYELVNESLCEGKLGQETNYTSLWQSWSKEDRPTQDDIEQMREMISIIPRQNWLKKVLGMRWGMIMTSAIDGLILENDFPFKTIKMTQKQFSKKDVSKTFINVSFLYGNINCNESDQLIPLKYKDICSPVCKKRISDRLNWIYNEILSEYGVLVIDGWDPETDWLQTLLDNAGEMPQKSIFLFGVTKKQSQRDDIAALIDENILSYDERTFARALEDIGFFEEEYDAFTEQIDTEYNLSLNHKEKGLFVVSVSYDAKAGLDPHITFLYDDIWRNKDQGSKKKLYIQFQQQGDEPIWHLYDEKYGFYFSRTQDKKLLEWVDKELQNSSYKRKYIMVEGNSNVGKTASLANLAYQKRNSVPVIYIHGEPTQFDWENKLKEFIKTQFLEFRKNGEKLIDSVLVIWDSDIGYSSTQRCKQLQDVLRECNTVVVGSTYLNLNKWEKHENFYRDNVGNYHLQYTTQLDKQEIENMLESIKGIDKEMHQMMEAYKKEGNNLLDALQRLIMSENRDEWKQVASMLQYRFHQEVDANEELAEKELIQYKKHIAEEVEEQIHRLGIASSFQLKLESIREQIEANDTEDNEISDKKNNLYTLDKHVKKLNWILAIAGEFAVQLPLTLVLRVIGEGTQKIWSNEQMFLMKVIRSDSLIQYTKDDGDYVSVSFRHPREALWYIDNNMDKESNNNKEKIKEKEVGFLCEMIKECRWNDSQENVQMLALTRSFGPNSFGKIGVENNNTSRRYLEYAAWWKKIADELIEAAEDQSEAILVYALFIRNNCRREIERIGNEDEKIKEDRIKELKMAREKLRMAIDQHDRRNTNQYCRLLGEICANLVYGMSFVDGKMCEDGLEQLKHFFPLAVKNWSDTTSQNNFTRNSLLDIWLNGVEHYFDSKVGDGNPMIDPKCAEVVADSIDYIDILLDLSEDDFDNQKLIGKVNKMYEYIGIDKLDELEKKLESYNNDTCLYLKAWNCWRIDDKVRNMGKEEKAGYIKTIFKTGNLYLIPDDMDRQECAEKIKSQLKETSKRAAQNAVEILEKKLKLIEKSRSVRCMSMLIRSKWLLYTGNMPLEIKQHPSLTVNQWEEIGTLCKKYIEYTEKRKVQPGVAPILLRMIYVWCFTKDNDAFRKIQEKQSLLSTNDWYFERICLCVPEKNIPMQFQISLQLRRESNSKYDAKITGIIDGKNHAQSEIYSCVIGKTVHVSDSVAQQLIGKYRGVQRYNIDQPVIIWFNAKGPQIAISGTKGGE